MKIEKSKYPRFQLDCFISSPLLNQNNLLPTDARKINLHSILTQLLMLDLLLAHINNRNNMTMIIFILYIDDDIKNRLLKTNLKIRLNFNL